MTFGERLRFLRESHGFSRQELATKLDLSYWAIAKYEQDERAPDHETLNKMANIFGVTIDYLLGRAKKAPLNTRPGIDTLAAHRDDDPLADLPEEARRSVEEYIEFVRQKYAAKKEG